MESGLRKGYRGGARRSSNVGVTESPPKGCRGAAERSSKVGVPVVRLKAKGIAAAMRPVASKGTAVRAAGS